MTVTIFLRALITLSIYVVTRELYERERCSTTKYSSNHIAFATVSLVKGGTKPHCSGQNISTFPDLNLQELRGEYFSYYKSNTFLNISPRLNDAVQKYVIPQNKASNKFLALVSGTNFNPDGGCLQGLVQGYQIKDNRPCFAIKFVEPVTCQEEEWLHLKLSNDKLVLYHCFKLNVDGSCGHKVIRGMSTKKFLSPADKQAFMDAFARFGEPLPEIADPVNNACEKIKREAHNFIEADRRFGDNANYYQH